MDKTDILIIESRKEDAEKLQSILIDIGYDVVDIIESIPEASYFSDNKIPDCILISIDLIKNKSDRESIKNIRVHQNIPIIYSITKFGKKTNNILKDTGASALFVKPVSPDELLSKIELVLHNHQKENTLRQEKMKFNLIIENINDVVWLADMNFNFMYISPSAEKIRGYTVHEIMNQPMEKMLTASSFKSVTESMSQYFDRYNNNKLLPNENYRQELEFIRKDGTTVWVEVNAKIVKDDNGTAVGIIGVDREITGRKNIEDSLKKEIKFTQMLMDTSPIGIVVANRDGDILSANIFAERILGLTISEIKKRKYNAPEWIITDLDGSSFPDDELPFSRVKKTRKPVFNIQHAIEYPDGKRVLLSINASPIFTSDKEFNGMVAIIEDITERKRSEELLKESRERYGFLFDNMIDGYAIHEIICNDQGTPVDYRFLDVNPAFEKMTGLSHEVIGKTIKEVMPDIEDYWIETYGKVAVKGEPVRFENYSKSLNKWFEVVAFQSGINKFVTIFVDITERKTTELALIESEDKFRRLTENAKDMIYRMNLPEGLYEYVSPAAFEITGYSPEEWYENPKLIEKVIHPDWYEFFAKEWENLLKGTMPETYEYQIIHKSGNVRWMNQRNVLIKDSKGNPAAIEGIVTDVTEKKLSDKSILEQKQRAERYFDVAGMIMVVLNDKGEVVRINNKGCSLLGYNVEEIVGKNWFRNFLPKEGIEEVRGVYKKIMNGEIEPVEYYENLIIRQDGTERIISWHNAFISDENGKVIGSLSSGEDITERKKAEEELKASLEEKEILLKEVHHRVKNNMQIISSLIHLLGETHGDEHNKSFVRDVEGRIRSMALIHEMIYKSGNYKYIDFRDYLEKLLNELLQSYSLSVPIALDLNVSDVLLDMNTAIPCALIIYELVVNSLKHAFIEREEGKIGLEFSMNNNEYVLRIWDNGIGLPDNLTLNSSGTIGIELVQSLTKQLDGSMEIEKVKGTAFLIKFTIN